MVDQLKPFSEVHYTTRDGENIRAIKNNGIVTIVGDKSGVRQMSVEQFKKELVANLDNVQLERTPTEDVVSFNNESKFKDFADKTNKFYDAYADYIHSNPILYMQSAMINPFGTMLVNLHTLPKSIDKLNKA